jgi:uncharacterized protein (TIGR03435 family)
MTLTNFSLVENHLWQSTLCVAVAWLLTRALAKNRAAVRYWIWFAASLKFLIPFSLLVNLGGLFEWRKSSVVAPTEWAVVVKGMVKGISQVGDPFTGSAHVVRSTAVAPPHSIVTLPVILLGIWFVGVGVSLFLWFRSWREMRAIRQHATPLELGLGIPALSTPSLVEPGVFGIFRPALLVPEGITVRLTPAQFNAVLAHEMCHVRRRDNLTAAIHLVIEALFWFYPLIWWIRTKLVEERERACDEAVLQAGSEPEAYAQSILNVCRFYVESPACASGISGSDLKKRVVRILTQRFARKLSFSRRMVLITIGAMTLAGPLVFGLVTTPRVRAQSQAADTRLSFEVASIKLAQSGMRGRFFRMGDPSRFSTGNVPTKDLIGFAYHVQPFQISGGPSWIDSEGYDIEAKVDDSTIAELQKLSPEQRMDQYRLMLRSLLADRFKLKLDHQTKELPIYALVVAKGGPKLTPTKLNPDVPPSPQAKAPPQGPMLRMAPGRLEAKMTPITALAEVLGNQPDLGGRLVVDQTGIQGKYDFTLEFAPERPEPLPGTAGGPPIGMQGPPPPDPNAPSIFTAIQEQLGLKLEPSKGPVEILVIDSIEKPTEN